MEKQTKPLSRQSGIVVQEAKGELLIYDLKINKAYCLNKTSAMVYQLCDGNNAISDFSKELSKKLKLTVTDDLIWLAIDQFREVDLLSNTEEIKTKFEGLSRRDVIKKVGFASMVALPVISSLVAPTPAMAASCVGSGTFPPNSFTGASCVCGPGVPASCCQPQCDANASTCCSGTATSIATPGVPNGFSCFCS